MRLKCVVGCGGVLHARWKSHASTRCFRWRTASHTAGLRLRLPSLSLSPLRRLIGGGFKVGDVAGGRGYATGAPLALTQGDGRHL